jgi:HAMP domain-containing protein
MNAGLTRDRLIDLLDRWRDDGDAAARDRILAEFARLEDAIREHRDQRGDDRCWLDDYKLYEALGEPIPDHACRLDDPETMLEYCRKFIGSRHDPAKGYLSPQREIERLEGAVQILTDVLIAVSPQREIERLEGAVQILTDVLIAVATEGGTNAHEADG